MKVGDYMQTDIKDHRKGTEEGKINDFFKTLTFQIKGYGKWEGSQEKTLTYSSSDYVIVYYYVGGAHIIKNEKEYDCPTGSFMILTPFDMITRSHEGYETYGYYYVHFEINPVYEETIFSNLITMNGMVFYPEEIAPLISTFAFLLKEYENHELGYHNVLTCGLAYILVFVLRIQNERSHRSLLIAPHPIGYMQTVQQSIDYIEEHIQEMILLGEIGKYIGVSDSYLYKAFMNVLGKSPTRYIQEYKIRRSQTLLQVHAYSIEQISQMLGFSSPYHFSNVFKSLIGISPKKYEIIDRNKF